MLGVAPCDSGMCVDTAAGVGGAIVLFGLPTSRVAARSRSHGVSRELVVGACLVSARVESPDERYARVL